MGEPLTDEQIAEEEKFLAGLPRVNLGALFLAPVWGPAHGMWAAFLFFVAWLFADNVIYAATVEPTAMNVVLAILMAAGLVGATAVFAIVAAVWLAVDLMTKAYFDGFAPGEVEAGPFLGLFRFK